MTVAALIVAGGSGSRLATHSSDVPKQYARIAGTAMLTHTLGVFLRHRAVTQVQVVIRAGDTHLYDAAIAGIGGARLRAPVVGGATRQGSVAAGIAALDAAATHVLIHDAARPFLPAEAIDRLLDALTRHDAAILALPVADTLKREADGTVGATVDRAGLWAAQTPQGFRLAAIRAAHDAAQAAGRADFTDDAAIAEWAGLPVALVMGARGNWKITQHGDLAMAETLLGAGAPREYRTGSGFDVHAFGPGDHVMLCGVPVPFEQGLAGHSDADVALHALTDAILGAAALGDIGRHFPPSDPQWKGAESGQFLQHAIALAADAGGRLVHVDVTIIGERPKIGPVAPALIARLAGLCGLAEGRVSVKATTTERLGFPGRGEGLAALATATLSFPA